MILVTGGTGFIGRVIVKKLLEQNQKVRVLSRNADITPIHSNLEYVNATVLELDSLKKAVQGCDLIIHLVGIIRESGKQTFEKIHRQGTQNLVQAAKTAGIQKFIHISALGARANARSRYHKTKWEAEEIVRSSGIPFVIFRPSIVFGKEDEFINFFANMIRFFPGILGFVPVIGSGKNKFQPIWVEDVASCFVKAALDAKIANKEYVLAGPEIYTYDELLDLIMEILHKKRIKLHFPYSFMKTAAFFIEKLPNQMINRDQVIMLEEDNIGDNSNMKKDFSIEPASMEQILKTYYGLDWRSG